MGLLGADVRLMSRTKSCHSPAHRFASATARKFEQGSGVMRNTLIALWSGDFPLGQAFWHYAIAYGTIANILATAAAIAAVLAGLPDAVAIGLHFLPLPYVVMAVVGVWRSADKYRGDPTWAGIAKAAVIVWGALMVFV
jgi:hypothetical protein